MAGKIIANKDDISEIVKAVVEYMDNPDTKSSSVIIKKKK
jgi:hypothetical protein